MIKFNPNDKVNNTNSPQKFEGKPIVDEIKNLITKLTTRAEFEMTDVGHFSEIKELIKNSNASQEVGKFGFKIRKASAADKSEKVLELLALSKTGNVERSEIYKTGTRDEIVNELKKANVQDDLVSFIKNVSNDFYMKDIT